MLLAALREVHRVLRPGGRLLILQPNIRYAYREYWDFLDHHVALSHVSMVEALALTGFRVVEVRPRFLPFTTKSALPPWPSLVRLYLRVPLAAVAARQADVRRCAPTTRGRAGLRALRPAAPPRRGPDRRRPPPMSGIGPRRRRGPAAQGRPGGSPAHHRGPGLRAPWAELGVRTPRMPAPTTNDLDIQDAWDNAPLHGRWPTGSTTTSCIGRLAAVPGRGDRPRTPAGRCSRSRPPRRVHACRLAAGGLRTHVLEPSEVMLGKAREHMAEFGVRLRAGARHRRGAAVSGPDLRPRADRRGHRPPVGARQRHPRDGARAQAGRALRHQLRQLRQPVGAPQPRALSRSTVGLVSEAAATSTSSGIRPCPIEHTFECTYRNIGELCGQYLELERVVGVSLLWNTPGWWRCWRPSAPAGGVAARWPRRAGAAGARARRLRADGLAPAPAGRGAGQRPARPTAAGAPRRRAAGGAAAARRDHARHAGRPGLPAPGRGGRGLGGGLVAWADDRGAPAGGPAVGEPRPHRRSQPLGARRARRARPVRARRADRRRRRGRGRAVAARHRRRRARRRRPQPRSPGPPARAAGALRRPGAVPASRIRTSCASSPAPTTPPWWRAASAASSTSSTSSTSWRWRCARAAWWR